MILLPVITYFYGVEIAIPVSTIAQLMSNLSRALMGRKDIQWKQVGWFLIPALPFTALGAFGFSVINKVLMTRLLCVLLIIFSIMKICGKIHLKGGRKTMLIGGGVTGLISGMLGISGPLSSAVFLSLNLAPCRIYRQQGHGICRNAHRQGRDLQQVRPDELGYFLEWTVYRLRNDGRQFRGDEADSACT